MIPPDHPPDQKRPQPAPPQDPPLPWRSLTLLIGSFLGAAALAGLVTVLLALFLL